jgi:hypothetical protein
MINLALRYGRLVSTDGRPLLRRPLPDDAGLRKKLAELHGLFATPQTPPPLSGDGIVMTCNLRYWPMVCVGVRLMRELGIATPIQVWHDGPLGNELDGLARLVDVRAVRRIHPARKCTHFQGKTYALLHCGWRRVIHLDADAYLVRDPGPIFDLVDRCRFVYWDTSRWSDANTNKRLFPAIAQWVPCIQGGHYALDCAAYWHELTCARFMDDHADLWDHRNWDEDSWRTTISRLGSPYLCAGDFRQRAWMHYAALDGHPIILHRIFSKLLAGTRPRYCRWAPHEARVFELFREYEARHANPGRD